MSKYEKRRFVSIIILVFGDSKTILRSLNSIYNQKTGNGVLHFEVIVVTDRSSKRTKNFLQQYTERYSNMKCLHSDRVGVNAARNTGLSSVRAEVALFLDDDCVLPDNEWLLRLGEKIRNYPEAVAWGGGYRISDTHHNLFSVCQSQLTDYYMGACRIGKYETKALLGGNVTYKKEVFSTAGYFDEEIIYGGAETEFNNRLLADQKKLYYFEDIWVRHMPSRCGFGTFLQKHARQGYGKAYRRYKNIFRIAPVLFPRKKIWFLRVAKGLPGGFLTKTAGAVILFFYSLFYWSGYGYGWLSYKTKDFLNVKKRNRERSLFYSVRNAWPFISVVVPTFNRLNQLKKCIRSLYVQDYPENKFEIIVVNDGSTDKSEQYLKRLVSVKKNIRYKTVAHKGCWVGRNIGFRLARGEIIASLDDDCVVDKDWLRLIVLTFTINLPVAVGGSIINPYRSDISWAQHILNYSKWLPMGKIREIGDIPTCNIAYRKDQIGGINFFEDEMNAAYQHSLLNLKLPQANKKIFYRDSLFNLKLSQTQRKILFNPKIKAYHFQSDYSLNYNEFLNYQKYYALGFVYGGYRAHGKVGELLFRYPFLMFFSPRIIILFFRCVKSRTYLAKFIKTFPLIVKGEWARTLTIFQEGMKIKKQRGHFEQEKTKAVG